MKIIKVASIALLTLCTMSQTIAAETKKDKKTSTAYKGMFQKLKESPISLSTLTIISPDMDKKNIKGYSFSNRIYVGYKLTSKDSIRMENRWNTSKSHTEKTKTVHDRIGLSYTRRGVLNQKDHGVNMSVTVGKKITASNESRVSRNSNGNTYIRLSANRSLKKGFTE